MEAKNKKLYKDIIKKTKIQYTIPVYQRDYTWEKENCKILYDDIIRSIEENRNHYIGSIVYIEQESTIIKKCTLIDGQQRLTTIMLLLKALADTIHDKKSKIKEEILEDLYNNQYEERYKLKLKNAGPDNSELEKILMGNIAGADPLSKISINYNYFIQLIKETLKKESINHEIILKGIKKLEIVEIKLNESDEPQKIFESINSTGVNLTTADLIRNFLLMGIADPGIQNEKYKTYWITLEEKIGRENIEKFFYDFLVMKNPKYIEEKKVYENFKEYYFDTNDKELIFNEIQKYCEYYKLLIKHESDKYGSISEKHCALLGLLQHNTIYPFLLKICDDYSDVQKKYTEKLSKNETKEIEKREQEFNKILELLANYALRRNIVGIPSSSLRRFYATLFKKIFDKNKKNLNTYYKSIEAYLCTVNTEDRMPTDSKFQESLCTENLYRKPKILRYFFEIIENNNKEKVDLSELTIEHIMPETLSEKWKNDLGKKYQEIYEKYVHTLGNLSITGYNSEYSNLRYNDKRKKLKEFQKNENIKILKLNKELLNDNIKHWSKNEIENRAKRLASIIMKKFPYPKDIDYTLEFEKFYELYIETEESTGEEFADKNKYKIYGYQYCGTKYRSKNFKDTYVQILKNLYNENSSILEQLAKDKYKSENGKRIIFSKELIEEQSQTEIAPNLFVETGYSRQDLFYWIRFLFEKYQLNISDFSILFTDKEQ